MYCKPELLYALSKLVVLSNSAQINTQKDAEDGVAVIFTLLAKTADEAAREFESSGF